MLRTYLNATYVVRWIEHGGSVPWLPRSPNLSSFDYFLRAHLRNLVYATPLGSDEYLVARIFEAVVGVSEMHVIFERVRQSLHRRCQIEKSISIQKMSKGQNIWDFWIEAGPLFRLGTLEVLPKSTHKYKSRDSKQRGDESSPKIRSQTTFSQIRNSYEECEVDWKGNGQGTLNSRRAASPLMCLVEGEERWEPYPGCSSSKLGLNRDKSYCHLYYVQGYGQRQAYI
ncbi:uncharacterized protein TNCV_1446441 [Trichonephila clavipes]|nr:uncharacterized protein TNCV_1446441 [Trichonephila clavipes]